MCVVRIRQKCLKRLIKADNSRFVTCSHPQEYYLYFKSDVWAQLSWRRERLNPANPRRACPLTLSSRFASRPRGPGGTTVESRKDVFILESRGFTSVQTTAPAESPFRIASQAIKTDEDEFFMTPCVARAECE